MMMATTRLFLKLFYYSYLLQLLLSAVVVVVVVDSQPIEFCGDNACRIPLADSCADMKANNDFFGLCCYMEDIVGTGGCRIIVTASGNCAWSPKCGSCPPNGKCNIDHQTTNTDPCPTDKYNVLANPSPPAPCPTPATTQPPAPSPTTSSSSAGLSSLGLSLTSVAASSLLVVL